MMTIRQAVREDVPLILDFIKGIAAYEKMSADVKANEEMIASEVFDHHRAEVIFVEEDGKPVGFALYFYNFSTFVGHSGLYLEDLFVYPEYRGKGYGKALFMYLVRLAYGKALLARLAAIARERGCGRMEWSCLDWNQPSIDFYRSMGAVPMSEWTTYRLTADTMRALVDKA